MATADPSDEDVYKMTSVPRGICVIINNKAFRKDESNPSAVQFTDRHGTDKDKEALEKTFDAFGFVVERYDDVKGTEMIHIIEDTARKNHSAYDCFVCCILSHGNLGLVCGSDGVAVEIKDLTAAVKPARCPSLTGKPKMFIMQACQGSNRQYGHPAMETDAEAVQQELIPNEADFLLAYSTVPGFVSYRDGNTGSYFIQELTTRLNSLQKPTDIHQILTKVNAEVGKKTTSRGYKQSPAPLYSLRKQLLLGPVVQNPTTLRVVLLGKTGAGKSSLGNNLLGLTKRDDRGFKVGRGIRSETRFCGWRCGRRNGLMVEVTDTPGLCDTHLPEDIIYKEVGKSLALASPGPHVFIFTTRCDRRFTSEELVAYKTLRKMFSEQMDDFLIVVFNGLGGYDEETLEEKREELRRELFDYRKEIDEVLTAAGGRFFGMDNKASEEEVERQIKDLLDTMMALVRQNEFRHYQTKVTTEICDKVTEMIDDYAKENQVTKGQAEFRVKQAIIKETVDSGFLDSITAKIKSANRTVTEPCSVM